MPVQSVTNKRLVIRLMRHPWNRGAVNRILIPFLIFLGIILNRVIFVDYIHFFLDVILVYVWWVVTGALLQPITRQWVIFDPQTRTATHHLHSGGLLCPHEYVTETASFGQLSTAAVTHVVHYHKRNGAVSQTHDFVAALNWIWPGNQLLLRNFNQGAKVERYLKPIQAMLDMPPTEGVVYNQGEYTCRIAAPSVKRLVIYRWMVRLGILGLLVVIGPASTADSATMPWAYRVVCSRPAAGAPSPIPVDCVITPQIGPLSLPGGTSVVGTTNVMVDYYDAQGVERSYPAITFLTHTSSLYSGHPLSIETTLDTLVTENVATQINDFIIEPSFHPLTVLIPSETAITLYGIPGFIGIPLMVCGVILLISFVWQVLVDRQITNLVRNTP